MQKWKSNSLAASEPRGLPIRWVVNSVERIEAMPDYRRRLVEKTGTENTAHGWLDKRIHLEGVSGPYTLENTGGLDDEGSDDD